MIIFDCLSYEDRPTTQELGMVKLHLMGHWSFWADGKAKLHFDASHTHESLKKLPSCAEVCINIEAEGWRTDYRQYGKEDVRHAMHQWIRLLTFCRALRPDCSWGVYATWPIRDYWSPVNGKRASISRWKRANSFTRRTRNLLTGRLEAADPAELCDYIYPSLYEFYDEPEQWVKYANANIAEARKYGKNVRPFLWPEFHNSNAQLAGQNIPGEHWRVILQACKDMGVDPVIWGGWQQIWNPDAEWWMVTKDFIGRAE